MSVHNERFEWWMLPIAILIAVVLAPIVVVVDALAFAAVAIAAILAEVASRTVSFAARDYGVAPPRWVRRYRRAKAAAQREELGKFGPSRRVRGRVP